jgi:hypothetical protein
MVESTKKVGKIQLTYGKKTLSSFAATNFCRATEKFLKIEIDRIAEKEDENDFLNVKLNVEEQDYHG